MSPQPMAGDDSSDLRRLVESCDAFSRCEECGTHVVNLSTHRCAESDSPSDRPRPYRRDGTGGDSDDTDDAVGIFRRAAGDAYAYHELDGDDVYCWCGGATKATRLEIVSRAEAESLGRTPCGTCKRLRELRADGE